MLFWNVQIFIFRFLDNLKKKIYIFGGTNTLKTLDDIEVYDME